MKDTRRLTLCAVLVAMAMALSYMERFIPLNLAVPLPGVKLGLANVVTLLALYFLDIPAAATVLILRCVLNTPFSGSVTALVFSLTGGLLALGVMALGRRIPFISVYGVSILGAAAHNIGQILAASLIFGSAYVIAYLPFLLLVALVTGFITGSVAAGAFRGLHALGQVPGKRKEGACAGTVR